MKRFTIGILLCFLAQASIPSLAEEMIATRYGKVVAVSKDEKTAIRYRDKVILKLDVESAQLHRITSDSGHEYVIVDAWHPGLNCHHFFRLVDLSPDGAVAVSKEFGECTELVGAGFSEGIPVVHLENPFIEGNSYGAVSYAWKRGVIGDIFTWADECRFLDFAAKTSAKRVPAADSMKQVAGAGRLQFFSAPDLQCAKQGLFVVAGDRVSATLDNEDFALVTYTHPTTGKRHEGWVASKRLTAD